MTIKFLGEGEEFDVGDTIRIESTIKAEPPFSDDKNLQSVANVDITITDYNGTDVVDDQAMTEFSEGQYFYEWDTTGLGKGDFEVVVTANENGITEIEDDFVRLTD